MTVEVTADGPQGPVPQENIEVGFYPFDRDSIFDVLDSRASSPKPEIPDDMVTTFQEIRTLQEQAPPGRTAGQVAKPLEKRRLRDHVVHVRAGAGRISCELDGRARLNAA